MAEYLEYKYVFEVEGKGRLLYPVKIEEENLDLVVTNKSAMKADWTDLNYHKCENCPLNDKRNPKCPVAMGIHQLTEFFSDDISFTKAKVTVVTPERAYYKETSLQQTLSSLLGLIIATSNCPHTTFLKPMARFHLPFATSDETLFRVLGSWLMHEHFDKGEENSTESLTKLNEKYKELSTMNKGLISRVRSFTKGDANRNALIVLECFTGQVQSEISSNLEDLKRFFPDTKK